MAATIADEIRAIKPGKSKIFPCASIRECLSLQSRLTYIKYMGLPGGVGNLTSTVDKENMAVIVRAVPVEEISNRERRRGRKTNK